MMELNGKDFHYSVEAFSKIRAKHLFYTAGVLNKPFPKISIISPKTNKRLIFDFSHELSLRLLAEHIFDNKNSYDPNSKCSIYKAYVEESDKTSTIIAIFRQKTKND